MVADPDGNELARHRHPVNSASPPDTAGVATQGRAPGRPLGHDDMHHAGAFTRVAAHPRRHRARACAGGLPAGRPTPRLTTGLAQTHTVIGGETLAVKNMMAGGGVPKRGLNRALGDAGLGEVFRQLDYKTGWTAHRSSRPIGGFPARTCARAAVW